MGYFIVSMLSLVFVVLAVQTTNGKTTKEQVITTLLIALSYLVLVCKVLDMVL